MKSFLGEGMCFLTSPGMLLGKQTASVQARCGTTEPPILFSRLALLAFEAAIRVTMSNLHFSRAEYWVRDCAFPPGIHGCLLCLAVIVAASSGLRLLIASNISV